MLKKIIKVGVLVGSVIMVVGCVSALNTKESLNIKSSGIVVYASMNGANYKTGEDAIKQIEDWTNSNICADLGGMYCDKNYRANLVLHNGNIKINFSNLISKLNILTPKDIIIKNDDIVKAKILPVGLNAGYYKVHVFVGEFDSVVAHKGDKSCYFDTGVVCPKYNWNYKDNLPKAML